MNTDKMFPSKYLKAGELPEEGTLPVTIEKITIEEIGPNKDKKPVIHFEELDKALVCNKTNANTIAKLTSSKETDDWIGVKINLYRAEVEFQGEMIEAIRISIKKASSPKPHAPVNINEQSNPTNTDDDEIPF